MIPSDIIRRSRHPFCIGIGGIGVSAIARYFALTGRSVEGFDDALSAVTVALPSDIRVQTEKTALPESCDLVVYSDAVSVDHPLRRTATARGVQSLSYAQALAGIVNPLPARVVVTGTNGKTTTTAMLASILLADGRDPRVVVGSLAPQLGGNFRLGDGRMAVCEGDDYRGHFLELEPTLAVVTNVAHDHPDFFSDLGHVQRLTAAFIAKVPSGGTVVLNEDDEPSHPLRTGTRAHVKTFSTRNPSADLFLKPAPSSRQRQPFELWVGKQRLAQSEIRFPGEYNLSNAAAAALAALTLGVQSGAISGGLRAFRGTWRRFELVGRCRGAEIVSDYAHHPDAVEAVIRAAKGWYADRRLVVVFQPHHRARLHGLLEGFADALRGLDACAITEVYDVLGRDQRGGPSAERLVERIQHRGGKAVFTPTFDDARQFIEPFLTPDHVVLALGAGSIDQWARQLVC